jgi:hypothetical protein
MKRREFMSAGIAAALTVGALRKMRQVTRAPDILTYLDRQITPAAAAQAAAQNTSGKLNEGDIFWSVMWPYMYTVGCAEGTVENSLGLDPYQLIYTYDSFR